MGDHHGWEHFDDGISPIFFHIAQTRGEGDPRIVHRLHPHIKNGYGATPYGQAKTFVRNTIIIKPSTRSARKSLTTAPDAAAA
jgi:hypothetical protein